MTAKEYDEICQLLYLHLKQLDEDFTATHPDEEYDGLKWSVLVDWYMEEYSKEVSEQNLLDQRRKLINQVWSIASCLIRIPYLIVPLR